LASGALAVLSAGLEQPAVNSPAPAATAIKTMSVMIFDFEFMAMEKSKMETVD
jgi:hypothetical protein